MRQRINRLPPSPLAGVRPLREWGFFVGGFHDLGYVADVHDEDDLEYSLLEPFRMIRASDHGLRELLEEHYAKVKQERGGYELDGGCV
ncbi:hypothetical protein L211DRAFT_840880 [Terfezia boudieri ATCC MYA-4762]|uniref:Uncharacterized protein n=1 Tax=Terfezia boudieri ATCC MYA-4762 TaxID=1051890 RepID=A0A3N4LIJ3_9PEZI|nr:hypothetical protein L211DRAFT_840880 [Terfezia boudieri ATCC MYA-4762]